MHVWLQQKILLWEDLVSKVNGGVNDPIENYMGKFPDLKVGTPMQFVVVIVNVVLSFVFSTR